MSQQVKKLSVRFSEILLDGNWVLGTNFKQEIENTEWNQAIKSMYGLNSIADLTFHINYYLDGVNHFFESGELNISDKNSFNNSAVKTQEDWLNLTKEFVRNAEKFKEHIESFSEGDLQTNFVKQEYGDLERNINVMIEHTTYHLGQIMLIKKLVL